MFCVALRDVGADIRLLPLHFISLLPVFSLKLDGVLIVHGLGDIFRLHWHCLCDPGCCEHIEWSFVNIVSCELCQICLWLTVSSACTVSISGISECELIENKGTIGLIRSIRVRLVSIGLLPTVATVLPAHHSRMIMKDNLSRSEKISKINTFVMQVKLLSLCTRDL